MSRHLQCCRDNSQLELTATLLICARVATGRHVISNERKQVLEVSNALENNLIAAENRVMETISKLNAQDHTAAGIAKAKARLDARGSGAAHG